MNTAYFSEIERLLRQKYTGTITLHVNQGNIKKVDQHSEMRVEPSGTIHINERKGMG